MKRYELRAALDLCVDGCHFGQGAIVAVIETDVPLGCILAAMRQDQLSAQEVALPMPELLQHGVHSSAEAAAASGQLATADASSQELSAPKGKKPAAKPPAVKGKKPAATPAPPPPAPSEGAKASAFGLAAEVQAKLVAAGLTTEADVREHFEAFGTFEDVPDITPEDNAAIVALLPGG